MDPATQEQEQLTTAVISQFWDAEYIFREANSNTFKIIPPDIQDDAVAARIGIKLSTKLLSPVLVWCNDSEAT